MLFLKGDNNSSLKNIELFVFSENYTNTDPSLTDTGINRDMMKLETARHEDKTARDQSTLDLSNHCWQDKEAWKKLLLLSPGLITASGGALAPVLKDEL